MPSCSSVSSSAQSSTTMATLLILSLNRRGSVRRARSTSVSNSGRVMRERPRGGGLEAADSFHVHDVLHFAEALHDALQLLKVLHLDDEMVEALPVVGDGDLRLGDVALAGGDGRGDLGEDARTVAPDIDGDPDRTLGRLAPVPLHGHQPLLVEHVLDHGQAVARVYGQPAAPRDEAHD